MVPDSSSLDRLLFRVAYAAGKSRAEWSNVSYTTVSILITGAVHFMVILCLFTLLSLSLSLSLSLKNYYFSYCFTHIDHHGQIRM